jgi:hypothetical protein
MVDSLLIGRAASSGSILGMGVEEAGGTTAGTVNALAEWVAGGLAREAAARLPGDGDGRGGRPAGQWRHDGIAGTRWDRPGYS